MPPREHAAFAAGIETARLFGVYFRRSATIAPSRTRAHVASDYSLASALGRDIIRPTARLSRF
ncbi:hypothetical protein SAMN02799625_04678 [Methylobacterium sp. UNC300MFChir4.1]|nr:hypothetical protein SAMN02799625_04678 [Methylobacterium sp. UNC300MFChir4.1]